ncbi:hypothetical protein NDU88_000921 [Pleurodeles waltl]|uniref:Uncharacterized protein n=1 Tax=Pleurodeles waltl TaxID=8319 RepID=A0AAV7Q4I8_PLEWA|nr:hypothetical protein NDU88_000921 [Pleurodeles waltl]
MAISSLPRKREHINCSPGVCAALAVWAPGVRKAAAGSRVEPGPSAAPPVGGSWPPSARRPPALSVPPAASLGVRGAQQSGLWVHCLLTGVPPPVSPPVSRVSPLGAPGPCFAGGGKGSDWKSGSKSARKSGVRRYPGMKQGKLPVVSVST